MPAASARPPPPNSPASSEAAATVPARRGAVLTSRSLGSKTWSVENLTQQAIATSPQVAAARAEYHAARAAIGTAGERPNPTVALTPQVVTPFTKWITGTYGVDFDWTFETAGKRGRRLDIRTQ